MARTHALGAFGNGCDCRRPAGRYPMRAFTVSQPRLASPKLLDNFPSPPLFSFFSACTFLECCFFSSLLSFSLNLVQACILHLILHRSSSRSTLTPLTPLNLVPRREEFPGPNDYLFSSFEAPSQQHRVRTYSQSWQDAPPTVGADYGAPLGRDYGLPLSGQSFKARVPSSTVPSSMLQSQSSAPGFFFSDDENIESSVTPPYLEMMPASSRRSRTGQYTRPAARNVRSDSLSSSATPVSPTSPRLGPLPPLPRISRSRESACSFKACTETRLNWSPYCYKHQCRAFQCYEHVCRSNSAYCVKHHQESNPQLELV
ncbi:hypothetical protein P389DRAFT_15049 [Cystobasidium minutum MCA 4210]|uniref:uncharacterized protein n=1 Tax=Cystobasidium minutum MCA 4210 TaxID=1397322 RepID=UPI0034CDFBB8|eukprot:jgi/Rhomi1/15049/CE15048_71